MTIRKGEPWGEAVDRPVGLRVAGCDADVAEAFRGRVVDAVGLSGGDLYRAVGSPPTRSAMQRLPIDVLDVTADGHEFVAVAHVVARRGWWRGRILAVMNVDHLGDWNVAPRAHPNDGRFDVIDVDPAMTVRERWQARGRLAAGTHVPHPRISVRTGTEMAWSFDRPCRIRVDGADVTEARELAITVRPDAFAVVV
jgi:hypothetical protein